MINLTANYSLLSEVTLSGNPCNFHILSLNNLTNFSAIIFSIVIIKYNILKNLSHTTKIELWSLDTGNFIIKSTNIYYHNFSGTVFGLSFSVGISILFFILWLSRLKVENSILFSFSFYFLSSFLFKLPPFLFLEP